MRAGQPIQLGALVAGRAGKQAGGSTEFSGVLIPASGVMPLGLTGLHEGVEVKLVGIPFSVDLGHYILVIIISAKEENF